MSQIADHPGVVDWASNLFVPTQEDFVSRSEPARWLANAKDEFASSFNRSNFLRVPFQNLTRLLIAQSSIRDMWGVERNWDSHGAMPPNRTSIHEAARFVEYAIPRGISPDRIEPSAEGGVAVAFCGKNRRAIVEFLNAGDRDLLLYDKSGNVTETGTLGNSFDELIDAIRAYLDGDARTGSDRWSR